MAASTCRNQCSVPQCRKPQNSQLCCGTSSEKLIESLQVSTGYSPVDCSLEAGPGLLDVAKETWEEQPHLSVSPLNMCDSCRAALTA